MSDQEGRGSSPVFGGIKGVELFKFGELMARTIYKFIVKILENKYGESSENPRIRVPREGFKLMSSDFCGEAKKSRKQRRKADNRQVQRKSRQRNTWSGPERSTEDSPDRSIQESPERSNQESPERSTEDSHERSNQESSERSIQDSPEGSIQDSPEGSIQESPEGSIQESPEGSIQESPEGSIQDSPEGSIQESPERSTEDSPEGSIQESPERSTEDSPEGSIQESPERSTEDSPEGSIQESPERSIQESPERSTEDSHEGSNQESSERSTWDSPEGSIHDGSERSTRDNPESQPKGKLRDKPCISASIRDRLSTSAITRDRPCTSASIRDRLSTSAITRDRPSTSASIRDRPSTSAITRDRLSTSAITRDRPSTSASIRDRPSTSAITRDRPSTSASIVDRPSTSASIQDRPCTSASIRDRPSTSAITRDRPSTSATTWERPDTPVLKRKIGDDSSSSSCGAIKNFKLGERLKMYKSLIGRIEQGLEASSRSLAQQVIIRNQRKKIRSMFAQDGIDVPPCDLNPVVVLTDFRRSPNKKLPLDTPPKTPPVARTTSNDDDDDLSSDDDIAPSRSSRSSPPRSTRSARSARSTPSLSPTPSRSSTPSTSRGTSGKRKRPSESSLEYEIEAIVGYHRDKRNRMWYLIKWKDWDEKYNTFEPIDNLTSCHYELMKYFELVPPSQEDLKKKRKVVSRGMKQRNIYKKLVRYNYRAKDLEEFSRNCLDLSQLFEATDLSDLERHIREEYGYMIRCLIGMYGHQDFGLLHRAQNYKLFLKLIKVRRRQLQKISATEHRINSLEITPLKIENNVDMDTFPNIDYIVHMKHMRGVEVPKAILGCDCTDCTPRSRCCGKLADSTFAYGSNARLRIADRIAIYECNTCCKCSPTCNNRIVQRGRQVKLCIFKTKTYGWGVKTLEKISKGTFVCQYIGEMIPDSEAVVRDVTYLQEKKSGYLFDLDFFEDPKLEMFCIDATECGNVARFINHSCDPNLAVYPVWIDNPAPNMHHLAFFAKRNISKNEELNFDYENLEHKAKETGEAKPWAKMVADMRCQCKAANCREWVFGNK